MKLHVSASCRCLCLLSGIRHFQYQVSVIHRFVALRVLLRCDDLLIVSSILGRLYYLAVGAQWVFRPLQGLISPVLCSCDVLLLLTGLVPELM
jgi:hypothetical protein